MYFIESIENDSSFLSPFAGIQHEDDKSDRPLPPASAMEIIIIICLWYCINQFFLMDVNKSFTSLLFMALILTTI